ncbi:preprotein translocase subunit SecE [Streptococcus pluranimalium]|uniref:Preprotein translocase subunit SecE n=2 Tax=Streptococcus TaxID=1301 RepID=V6Z0G2_STRAG|nr:MULTISPECIES: preprotein translocase subunit SecE [Streptococcus]ESV53726.1 preprotein translocase subunit SecE [Streptococcus agalactiae LMG 14747]MDY3024055.1 preprotein translocase subunit SecE [Streptococcus hyovaginalis]MDY4510417.1 preprotein translocase subunit SecE [Streptococcus hyovaginalis]MDY5974083.1 preprotein translocase subunit SecE [Streptococcus hyovaginalis]SNV46202.1 preprotein translocase subunit [Streptococcus acidominimus]
MKFIPGIFRVLKDTTWPDRKQRWKDFLAVIEYTAFFTLIIYLFDKLLSTGIVSILNIF